MKKELDPKIITIILVVVVLIIGGIIYWKTGPSKQTVTPPTPEQMEMLRNGAYGGGSTMPTAPVPNTPQ